MTDDTISRRRLLEMSALGLAGMSLAGCVTAEQAQDDGGSAPSSSAASNPSSGTGFNYALAYSSVSDGGFKVPAVPWEKIDKRLLRQRVANTTGVGPGKIVVETRRHYLYVTESRGRAVRYGVGLGRQGFEWSGQGYIKRKAKWPKWHPPAEMIDREPKLEKFRTTFNRATGEWEGGMEPGLLNPLGARAHYIFQGEVDTLYRLHGSPEWWSIGKSVSSGCVRLINQDVIDLFKRVSPGTEIIVR
ncbi:MAG: L,D-transpeptidase [Pseudomonadota bacterium]